MTRRHRSHSKYALTPAQLIAVGFALVIAMGTLLLSLPIAHRPDIPTTFTDNLFTATSAVCITGLLTVDLGSTYTVFGQVVIACLIQIGGLGITSLGVGIIALAGQRVNFRERVLIKEALNYPSFKDVMKLIRWVLILTFSIELIGALLCLPLFLREYPLSKAIGISVFHAIAAFNNAGMDIFGRGTSMIPYAGDVALNLITAALVIVGGIGFFVITEVARVRKWKKCSLQTKVVLSMTGLLLASGTVLLKLSEGKDITWLGAFFSSMTARTAGFATFSFGNFSEAGLLVMMVLMFIGASPGSTGGGMKTTTFFVFLRSLFTSSTNRPPEAFRRRIPTPSLHKATTIISLGLLFVIVITVLICRLEPSFSLSAVLFEVVSAIGTVGLTVGITPSLSVASRLLIILTMYVGRLGPLTVASMWVREPDTGISLPEENLSIG